MLLEVSLIILFLEINNKYLLLKNLVPVAPPVPSNTQPITTTTTTTTTPGGTTTPRSGGYQSTLRPTTGGINTPDTSDSRTFPKPALRPVNPDQQNTYAKRIAGDTPTPASQSGPGITRPTVRINEPGGVTNRPTTTTTTTREYGPSRTQESIFEKVPAQGGPVSYLGTGTFSQFEHCLRECLERERRQTGIESHIIRQDLPSSISAHDYGYDPVSATPSPYNGLNPTTVHQFIDYPSRPTASFSIDDIRHINVALSRSGISLFPYCPPYHDSDFSPISLPSTYPSGRHTTGEVVSACRVVEEDQAIISSRNGIQAVQNVWNAIQNHRPFSSTDHSRSSVSPRGLYDF